ncbi:hypothetical protein GCM10010317_103010 [Streptomyces mirabilis]|nr:hypothetical protein GCM10010317_103010 [Streptomyces mirabilis]
MTARDFHTDRPGTKLVGDITFLPTDEGRLQLACWPALATREVVGYALADHHPAILVIDALRMAAGHGRLQPDGMAHSDRGSAWPDRATAHAEVFAFIEAFYDRRRLRKHKVCGYLTPAETRQRHQHAPATWRSNGQNHGETSRERQAQR